LTPLNHIPYGRTAWFVSYTESHYLFVDVILIRDTTNLINYVEYYLIVEERYIVAELPHSHGEFFR